MLQSCNNSKEQTHSKYMEKSITRRIPRVKNRNRGIKKEIKMLKCPKCGKSGAFHITTEVTQNIDVIIDSEHRPIEITDRGDIDWEDTSMTKCNECGYEGQFKEFKEVDKEVYNSGFEIGRSDKKRGIKRDEKFFEGFTENWINGYKEGFKGD